MKGRKLLAWMLIIILAFGVVGCTTPGSEEPEAPAEEPEEPAEGEEPEEGEEEPAEESKKILRYSLTADVPTLDQHLANSIPSATVGHQIFEGLIRTYQGEVRPGIAEDWDMSEDGTVYTFYLRDAQWSDGEPVTAQDFEYSFRRLLDPETASGYAFIGMALKNANAVNKGEVPVEELGVRAIDEKTLEVELENPAGYFLSMLSMMQFAPTRQDYVEEFGKDYAANAENNAYNGPFIVKEWRHEDRLILEKNPNYWDADSINLDEVHIIIVPDQMTALAMFEDGELDMVEVPAEVVSQYEDDVEYYYNGANDFIKLQMDGSSPLENKDLRLALNYALDRQEFIMLSTGGLYDPNPRYVLPQVNGVDGEYGDEYPYEAYPVEGDVDKALEHLDAAMEALGVSDPSEIELELLTTDVERTRKEAEIIQDDLESKLGIKINIRQVPYKQRLEMEGNKEFEMVVTGWAPDYSDPMTYLELWTTDSGYNHGSYSNPEYDAKIELARTSTDPQERMDAMFEAEKILLEDGAIIPLQLRRIAMLTNPDLVGFESYFVGLSYEYTYADFK
ncbi:MAG: peptide ABC transporter substrate-binding protein [Tissierellales bacterium]|nr:peptide ABC transporter substrate-binding protein [Tissierellales bacterium]